MDPKLAAILGIRNTSAPAPTIAPAPDPSINSGYRGMGLPPISRAAGDVVESFHRAAIQAIQEEQAAAVKAVKQIDPNLKSEVRLARAAAIGQVATASLRNRLIALAAPMARLVADARAIVEKALVRTPDRIRVEALRDRFDHGKMGGKVETCMRLAGLGDEAWPALFLDPAFETGLPQDVVDRGRDAYLAAYAGDAAATLAQAEEALEEVKSVLNMAALAMNFSFTQVGVPRAWQDLRPADILGALPARTKQLIEAADGTLWDRLKLNKASFDELVAIIRPGLVLGED